MAFCLVAGRNLIALKDSELEGRQQWLRWCDVNNIVLQDLFSILYLGRRVCGESVVVSAVIWYACNRYRNKLISSEEIVMLMPGAFIVCD